MLKFCWILVLVTDFGIVIIFLSIWYLNKIWAGVFLYLAATSFNLGSSMSWGSSGFAHGRSGEPNGLYPVTSMPFDLQKAINLFWFRYGWHSICKTRNYSSVNNCFSHIYLVDYRFYGCCFQKSFNLFFIEIGNSNRFSVTLFQTLFHALPGVYIINVTEYYFVVCIFWKKFPIFL